MSVAHGVDQKFFGGIESSFNAAMAAMVATDAISAVGLEITPEIQWIKSKEKLGTASLRDELKGYSGAKWKLTQEFRTAAAGSNPSHHLGLRLACGQAPTVVGGTSVEYTLAAAVASGWFARYVPSNLFEQVNGAWCEQVEVEVKGSDLVTWTFSGGAALYSCVIGTPVTTGTVATGASTFTLASSSRGKLIAGCRVVIGTDDNADAGYLVTAYDPETGVASFSPVLAGADQTGATNITPWVPSSTFTGTVRSGINSGLSLDSTSYGMIGAKLTWKTGIHGLDKEATRVRVGRIARGERELMVDLDAYYLDDELGGLTGKATSGVKYDAEIRLGADTAGARCKINIPKIRLDIAEISIPNAEESTLKIRGTPQRYAANEDEISFMFD